MDKKALITNINRIKHFNAFTSLVNFDKINVEKLNKQSKLPLQGTTFCVKDNFCTTGIQTTCGSK